KSYTYAPINSKKGYIRLLTIQPRAFDSPLEVNLYKYYQPQRSRSLNFDAPFYTWGSPADPKTLLVRSREKGKLHITRNLATALPYLRFPERERLIWIDAICINRLDYDKRTLQVQLMPDIYRAADHVVCWV
ncbi:hypothetical protein COCMIDRAFT_52799, partial [Bipolaris oryzae ATCC 44560]